MANLYARQEWVNATRGHRIGDSGVYETFTDSRVELFQAMRRECGRCIGRCHIDQEDGTTRGIGWVFQKSTRYEDTGDPYILETWVTLHEAPPTRTTEYHYHHLPQRS